MDEQLFDGLAKGLGDGTVSRGRALKLVGAALLGAMLPNFLLPSIAQANIIITTIIRAATLLVASAERIQKYVFVL